MTRGQLIISLRCFFFVPSHLLVCYKSPSPTARGQRGRGRNTCQCVSREMRLSERMPPMDPLNVTSKNPRGLVECIITKHKSNNHPRKCRHSLCESIEFWSSLVALCTHNSLRENTFWRSHRSSFHSITGELRKKNFR